MKKLFAILISFQLLLVSPCHSAHEWMKGTGEHVILGTENVSDIDKISYENIVAPLDRMLSTYNEGVRLEYLTAATLTLKAGAIMCSNTAGAIRRMRLNTSDITLTWANIDEGAEANDTYYAYAVADADATTFTGVISLDSTSPTGVSYYAKIATFENSSGDILNDDTFVNYDNYYTLSMGNWVAKVKDTVYQASTDGFVVGYSDGDQFIIYTDATSSPATVRVDCNINNSVGDSSGCCPIKKGDYYSMGTNVTATITAFFMPLEREV